MKMIGQSLLYEIAEAFTHAKEKAELAFILPLIEYGCNPQ